ncbi:MAG TPA: DUF3795 domain-containing protein [Treponemataceae bacterium]|nr:DUF3795 domain-containing protein [Treponemataceae bacterium]
MKKMIAACGLDCAECGALIAHKTNDDELRKKVAAEWTEMFKFPFTKEMINCTGCLEKEGIHAGYCSECKIRSCALGKGLANCAACADYPCAEVSGFHAACPAAKATLDALSKR